MAMFSNPFKRKEKSVLRPEDAIELKEIERKAYLEEARKLVAEKGKADAKRIIKPKEDVSY